MPIDYLRYQYIYSNGTTVGYATTVGYTRSMPQWYEQVAVDKSKESESKFNNSLEAFPRKKVTV